MFAIHYVKHHFYDSRTFTTSGAALAHARGGPEDSEIVKCDNDAKPFAGGVVVAICRIWREHG